MQKPFVSAVKSTFSEMPPGDVASNKNCPFYLGSINETRQYATTITTALLARPILRAGYAAAAAAARRDGAPQRVLTERLKRSAGRNQPRMLMFVCQIQYYVVRKKKGEITERR